MNKQVVIFKDSLEYNFIGYLENKGKYYSMIEGVNFLIKNSNIKECPENLRKYVGYSLNYAKRINSSV